MMADLHCRMVAERSDGSFLLAEHCVFSLNYIRYQTEPEYSIVLDWDHGKKYRSNDFYWENHST